MRRVLLKPSAAPAASELAKAHVAGHTRKDGVYVKPYTNKVQAKPGKVTVHHHPKISDHGKPVVLDAPSKPSAPSTWHSPISVATFVPDGDVPLALNGVAIRTWKDHPTTAAGWDYCDGVDHQLEEPEFHVPPKKYAASGVVIEEPDGRIWLVAPSNQYGGYEASFPKGTAEPDLTLQGNAVKEAFEETGLKVRITGLIGDFERTTSKARMYRAVRVGGTPSAMGWESQAVHLVPKDKLYDHLNMWSDHGVAEAVGAGPAPEQSHKPDLDKQRKWSF